MPKTSTIIGLSAAGLVAVLVLFSLHMMINCVYVYEGQSLMLLYKGPILFGRAVPAAPGQFAKAGTVGVQEELVGPGRHFYSPLWWDYKLVPDIIVEPGQVAIVTSKMGEPLPEGRFIVDNGLYDADGIRSKGILRQAFGPGRYRIHPYAYDVTIETADPSKVIEEGKHAGWVEIPAGYVGVVSNLVRRADGKRDASVQTDTLPPGIYPINRYEQQVDIVGIGYNESSISVQTVANASGGSKLDESGEPEAIPDTGINFPSNDGFPIQLDFTAIWGVMPEDAPNIIATFGNVAAVEQKVIIPQSESISRNYGSTMGATELLVGETRQKFQDEVSVEFQRVLKEKRLSLLYALVRHMYIPKAVRVPLQKGYIADELKLTRDEEITTKQAEGELREAEKKVIQEAEKVTNETTKLVASVIAEGDKEVAETQATTKQLVAQIDKEIAALEAKKTETLGKAKFAAEQLMKEAQSQKFQLAVEAFGTPEAYNKWQFAEGLPADINLQLFYAGEGTLWTDLKNVMPTLSIGTAGVASPAAGGTPRMTQPVQTQPKK